MKKIIFLVATGILPLVGLSQIGVNTELLDENNVGITLSDGGVFSAKPENPAFGIASQDMVLPGLEYPKGSGNYIMNGLSAWFGGVNEFDEPRISTPTNVANNYQFNGPLSNGDLATYSEGYKPFYSVSREEINYHITNFKNPNYVMNESISNWPAHGDVSRGMGFNLAPFVDTDNDGNYNPYLGDYPCIEGDRAIYMILNDTRGSYSCGGPQSLEGMGIEIHYMFYQYSSIRELENTTFCKMRVINRSTSNYTKFKTSVFMNPIIGSSQDGLVGTDVGRNMMYAYNGSSMDADYGSVPPAVGVVSLNHTINRSRVFESDQNYGFHFPAYPPEFWEVIQGNLLTGDSQPAQYRFSGDPVTGQGDIQTPSVGRNRMIYSIDIGQFKSGEEQLVDFAIVVGQNESNLKSIEHLRESVDFVKTFHAEHSGMCFEGVAGIPDQIDPPTDSSPKVSTTIYPNPSNGEFIIEVEEEWIGANLTVFTSSGLLLHSVKSLSEFQNNVKLVNGTGVYLVILEKDGVQKILKAVIE